MALSICTALSLAVEVPGLSLMKTQLLSEDSTPQLAS